jgi:hypothetical protein
VVVPRLGVTDVDAVVVARAVDEDVAEVYAQAFSSNQLCGIRRCE